MKVQQLISLLEKLTLFPYPLYINAFSVKKVWEIMSDIWFVFFIYIFSNFSKIEFISNKSSVNLLRLFKIRCLRTYL